MTGINLNKLSIINQLIVRRSGTANPTLPPNSQIREKKSRLRQVFGARFTRLRPTRVRAYLCSSVTPDVAAEEEEPGQGRLC
jgi:hypothetical protein